jgi:hypothetical protein
LPITDEKLSKIANGLARAASMTADALAAEKGEDNLFVQIKRNSERLDGCSGHEFEPQPDWRTAPRPYINRKIRCLRCGGEMPTGDAHTYLRGVAYGSGRNYTDLASAIWPPAKDAG